MTCQHAEAWRMLGSPVTGGVLLIADHASAHVPDDIHLGIAPELLDLHIASDIGVAEVAALLIDGGHVDAAIMGGVSRLVVDCNRDMHAPGLIPIASDGHAIPGNALDADSHAERVARFYTPYHARIADIIGATRPAMILSLHSFTPVLANDPQARRPWQVGVLYNQDDRLARLAIPALAAAGLCVGDQQPYSGRLLNYTMNRHAEANGIAYLGLEMRQDEVGTTAGQHRFSAIIGQVIMLCRHHLAHGDIAGQ